MVKILSITLHVPDAAGALRVPGSDRALTSLIGGFWSVLVTDFLQFIVR